MKGQAHITPGITWRRTKSTNIHFYEENIPKMLSHLFLRRLIRIIYTFCTYVLVQHLLLSSSVNHVDKKIDYFLKEKSKLSKKIVYCDEYNFMCTHTLFYFVTTWHWRFKLTFPCSLSSSLRGCAEKLDRVWASPTHWRMSTKPL